MTSRKPAGLRKAGGELWSAVTADYILDAHERLLLESACRTADLCEALQAEIDAAGPVDATGKTHPAVAEVRQQRLVLARLVVALRVPTGDEEARPQRRGLRGVYRISSAS